MDENLSMALYQVDWKYVVLAIFLLTSIVIVVAETWKKIRTIFGIEFKAEREKREEHELLIKTSKNAIDLQTRHETDVDNLKNELSNFMKEMRDEIKTFTNNRIHDRQQSLDIHKKLTDSIQTVVDSQKDRDKQIEALMCGSKELLGDPIDQRYSKYIALKGIPENEVDEFDSIYDAYKGLHGNHGRETKYNYVKEHLPVIPVETKLIINE